MAEHRLDGIERKCMLCGTMTTGSTGAAGLEWKTICQPCKDREDHALDYQLKTIAMVGKSIMNTEEINAFVNDLLSEGADVGLPFDGVIHHEVRRMCKDCAREASSDYGTSNVTLTPIGEGEHDPEPGLSRLGVMQDIVAKKQAQKVDGVLVDLFTASGFIAVYGALDKPENREKLLQLPLDKAVSIVHKLMADGKTEAANDGINFFRNVTCKDCGRSYDPTKAGQWTEAGKCPDCGWPADDRNESKLSEYGEGEAPDADELQMWIENSADLYRSQMMPIIQNVMRRIKNGTYDASLAPKLWRYLTDAGAKSYAAEIGGPVASTAVRQQCADTMAAQYFTVIQNGEYN